MRYPILVVGMALLCGLAFTACSNKADLGPEVGHAAVIASGVFGHCYDSSTPVNGITCRVYSKIGNPYFSVDVSAYDPVNGNGFYNCEEGALYQTPPDGTECIVVGYLTGDFWGSSDIFTWNQPCVGGINVIKDHRPG